MRRIYESEAIKRDDSEPFSPNEHDRDAKPRSVRSVNTGWLTRRLTPAWLRHRAVSVSIETPATEFPVGEPVPFRVTMKNALPFSISIPTRTPVLWNWAVDGLPEASELERDVPQERRALVFDRGERKQFTKRWNGMIRISKSEWERPEPGAYTLSTGLNVDDAEKKGLYDELTITLTRG